MESFNKGSNSSPFSSLSAFPDRSRISRVPRLAGSQPAREARRLLHSRTSRIERIEARFAGESVELVAGGVKEAQARCVGQERVQLRRGQAIG